LKRRHIIIHAIIVLVLLGGVGICRAVGWIDFFSPLWLIALLILPLLSLIAIKGMSGLPSHTNAFSLTVRVILFSLLVFCLAGIQLVLESDNLSVLFLLDHSASIPEDIVEKELQYVNAAVETKGRKDTGGIVIVGENSSVEVMPGKDLKVDRIYSCVGKGYTDLQTAMELATAAFPANARKKIVLITDGNENKGNLLEGIEFAAANQVETDILPVSYEYGKEVLVEKLYLPDKIKEKETFDLRVHIVSLQECPAELVIYRNGLCVARENIALKKGRSTYAVAMKIEEPGFYAFTARVSATEDTVPDNNEASGYVYIQGLSRILLVAPTELEVSHLAQACLEDNLEADIIIPQEFPESLGMLQNHDCVVLANVGADELTESQMAMLQANVRDLGVGLVMIGGENAFGAGGYEDTPVEEALPVTMDIRQKKINPKGALVLVLHTCEFADGNYWAKEISKKAIQTVNRGDDVGVLIYGNGEEWLFKLRPAEDKRFMYRRIDQASPGDMPSFQPTIQMAYDALSKSDAMVRHVIIISDGDPARPGPALVKDVAAAGITISTIAINPHSPRDVDVMKYLAYTTGGRYYFATDPAALPKIFVKEAKVVKRSLIFNKKFQPLLVLSTEVTKGISPDEVPPLMAYVATTPKPRALVPMVSDNENRDPVLAYWRYGLGKSVAFTSDASSNWAKEWIEWEKYKKLWTQVIRWASRKREKSNLRMHTEMDGNRGKLIIDAVDPKGRFVNFLKLNGRVVDPDNKGTVLNIRQTAPGRYEADFDAGKIGVNIINIGYQNPETGGQGFAATGVSIPYSPEYHKLESNFSLLRRAAAAGGGKILTGDPKIDRVFTSDLPAMRSFQPIWEYLLTAVLVVFFLDVVLRRVIITKEDIIAGAVALRNGLRFRKKAGEQDVTMAALLKRKKKTFERVAPAPPPGSKRDFKKELSRAAAEKKGERAELDTMPTATKESARAGEKRKAVETKPGPEAEEKEEDTYTSRLLAAKKRARKTGDE
jgi:uncharacterized membrane protein